MDSRRLSTLQGNETVNRRRVLPTNGWCLRAPVPGSGPPKGMQAPLASRALVGPCPLEYSWLRPQPGSSP